MLLAQGTAHVPVCLAELYELGSDWQVAPTDVTDPAVSAPGAPLARRTAAAALCVRAWRAARRPPRTPRQPLLTSRPRSWPSPVCSRLACRVSAPSRMQVKGFVGCLLCSQPPFPELAIASTREIL